jgi:LuxR family transcriptional regulator, maltose regulon positive regulatory protein
MAHSPTFVSVRWRSTEVLPNAAPDRHTGDAPYFIRQDGAWLRLVGEDRLEVDAWELEARLEEGERAERSGAPATALAAYQTMLPLWRGEPYADVPYAEWAEEARDRMRTRFVVAALRAGQLHLAMGNVDHARYAADRALAADPWAEGAHRLAVRACLGLGQRAAARRAIDRCRATLTELGLTPESETLALEGLVCDESPDGTRA